VSYKEEAIANAEQAINRKRQRRKQLETELAELEQEENEARAVLQLLKTGSAPAMRNGKRIVTKEELLEAIQAAGIDGQEFTPGDIAELVGDGASTVAGRLKRMATNDEVIVMVAAGGPGIPSKYKMK
jgi:chromosome segregation ATPase